MNKKLKKLWEKIENNKKKGKGACKDCPLQDKKYLGPCKIDQEGEKFPKIVIISESPAKPREGGNTIKEIQGKWYEDAKKWSEKKEKEKGNGKWPNKLVYFLFRLTDNKLLKPGFVTIPQIYWTHSIKCFIQINKKTIKEAKKELGKNFEKAREKCFEYLKEEAEILKNEAKIFIAVGNKAKEGIQKALAEEKIIALTHPAAPRKKEKKAKIEAEYEKARNEIMKYLT